MDIALLALYYAVIVLLLALAALAIRVVVGMPAYAPRDVGRRYELPWPPEESMRYLATHAQPVIQRAGYHLTAVEPSLRRFSRTYRPAWEIFLAVVLFPVGLLFLLRTRTDRVELTVTPGTGQSEVLVAGKLGGPLRDDLEQLLVGVGHRRSPAGWYEREAGVECYWDGRSWTDQRRRPPGRVVVGPRMRAMEAEKRAQGANR